ARVRRPGGWRPASAGSPRVTAFEEREDRIGGGRDRLPVVPGEHLGDLLAGGAGAGRGEQASDVLDVTLVAPNVVVVPSAGAAEVHAAVGVVLIAVRGEDGLKGSRLGVLGGRGGRLGAASGLLLAPHVGGDVEDVPRNLFRVVVHVAVGQVRLDRLHGFGAGVVGDGRAVGGGHGCPPRVSMTVRASSRNLSRSRSVSWCHH